MKSAVIYYSSSGNTAAVARIMAEHLGRLGQVDPIELEPLDESGSFLGQCKRAFLRRRAQLKPVNFDLSPYDLVCIGTPVWAFGPAPAINSYLDQCSGVKGKKIVLFSTYGSGTGNQRCLNAMRSALAKKGVADFREFSVQQYHAADNDFVLSEIKKVLE
jgi:flavodoxin